MITPDKIKAVMKAASEYAQISFMRADQDGMRPTEMFMSYKIINNEEEPNWRYSEEILIDELKPDKSIKHIVKSSFATVSITVIATSKDYVNAWNKCIKIKEFLESDTALNIFIQNQLIPKFTSLQIQDRSAYLETGFETRLGFDVIFHGVTEMNTIVDAIDLEKTISAMEESNGVH